MADLKPCPFCGSGANAELLAALKAVEPYLDAIICYASTTDEHEPNRVAALVRAALASQDGRE